MELKHDFTIPENKRLLLDLEILRDLKKDSNTLIKWVPTVMMLADPLTKLLTTRVWANVLVKRGILSIDPE